MTLIRFHTCMHQGMSQKITFLRQCLTTITTDILIWCHFFLPLILATYNDYITLCFHFVIPFGFIFLLYLFNYSLALDMVLYTHIRSGIIHLLEEYNIYYFMFSLCDSFWIFFFFEAFSAPILTGLYVIFFQ